MRQTRSCAGALAALLLLAALPAWADDRAADVTIRQALWLLRRNPGDVRAHYRLGDGYIARARETGDVADFDRAERALRKAVALAPDHAPAARHLAYVLYSRHAFAEAAAEAARAVALDPSDGAAYGILGDAALEVGKYDEAAAAYRRMMELGPDLHAYARRAGLASIRGEVDAAIADLERAIDEGRRAGRPRESIAWTQWQLGMEHYAAGRLHEAEVALEAALRTLPGYHRAFAGLAQVRAAQGRSDVAAELYTKALAVVPLPEYAAALGDLHARQGRTADARRQYDLVEYIGRLSTLNQVLYNRELALFLADHDTKLDEALALARKELELRRDVYAWDVLAWALLQNDRPAEAKAAITEALRLGTRDARLFYHAGMIHARLGDQPAARQYLTRALATNPYFHLDQAEMAARTLREIETGHHVANRAAADDLRVAPEPGRRRRWLVAIAAAALLALGITSPALAHPLGNFSVNHWIGIRVERDAVRLRYVIDLAEIPAFQEIQEHGLTPDPAHPSLAPYLARRAAALAEHIALEVDGRRLPLEPRSRAVTFPPGAAGLPTMKIVIDYVAPLAASGRRLEYRDQNFPGRAGWKEIVVTPGPGVVIVESSAPDTDRSRELSDYPTDLREGVPGDLAARVVFAHDGPPVVAQTRPTAPPPAARDASALREQPAPPEVRGAPQPANAPTPRPPSVRQETPRNAFTEIMTRRDLGFGLVLGALLVAVGLGALHALEPGHGKTVVAAYLVGSRGTARHAMLLGLIVTASHTAGVYLLGAVTLYVSRSVVPERLYPWLGAGSGMIIAVLGFTLFLRRFAGHHAGHAHDHGDHGHGDHDHGHHHDGGHHHHGHGHHHHVPAGVSLSQLFALGVSGGIVPCPAALVVLLSAVALQRVGFGLALIVAFSVGLAAVLIALGLLVLHARRFMARFTGEGVIITRWLPLTSSAIVTILGVTITVQALAGAGILRAGMLRTFIG